MDSLLKLNFEGYDADKHVIGMRDFGQSMIGMEKIINVGLIALAEGRPPKRGEKFPIKIVAETPQEGTVHLFLGMTDIASVSWLLPLVAETFNMVGNAVVSHWVSAVLLMNGGRVKQADPHFTRLAELMDSQGERSLEEQRLQNEMLMGVIDRLKSAAKDMVAPIGKSCSTLNLGDQESPPLLTVDEPTADIIRAAKIMELSEMQEITLTVDGYTHHNKKLKVNHPQFDGKYLNADIRDPAFDSSPNIYTDAAASKSDVTVMAKIAKSDDEIQRIYIMESVVR